MGPEYGAREPLHQRDRTACGHDFDGLRILTDREIGECVVVGKVADQNIDRHK